ncbi:MAG: hypothetical protein JOZ52_04355 [Acidobacteria bacterium]|nr:hypothetical protein [Acidobacteriota bacterium]
MFELSLGLVLAALFIGVYLLVAKVLLAREGRELGSAPPRVTLNPTDTSHALKPAKPPQALTAGELSEHHARGSNESKEES